MGLLDMYDGAETKEDPVPSSDHEAGESDSEQSRSGRSDEDEGRESGRSLMVSSTLLSLDFNCFLF